MVLQFNVQSGIPLVAPIPLRERASSLGHRPSYSQGHQRTLSARRGSISAPDPHGKYIVPLPRCALSRLTVVRVPKEQDKSMASSSPPRRTRSPGPNSPTFPDASVSIHRPHSPSRLSFASASFSTPQSPTRSVQRSTAPAPILVSGSNRGVSSDATSPNRMSFASASFSTPNRPRSPTFARHSRSSSASSVTSTSSVTSVSSIHRLSPNQIYDLAKSSSYPTAVNPSYTNSFTLLADDVYLPFVDRPSEVSALISNGGNAKIMRLVAQSFLRPINLGKGSRSVKDLLESPESWTFDDLVAWLTYTTRSEVSDSTWVHTLRRALRLHSEVLWERVKSMLGIPFELDVDILESKLEPAQSRAVTNEEGKSLSDKDHPLNIDQIHPLPFSPTTQLGGITEVSEDEGSNVSANGADQVLGLRVSTSLAFALDETSSPTSPKSPTHSRHGSRHSTVPIRSSPLAPSKAEQVAALASKNTESVGSLYVRATQSKIRPLSDHPMFPMNFARIGLHPTLLRVN